MKSKTFRIVEGEYLADILDQPRALRATCERLKVADGLDTVISRLQRGDFKRVVLTGMGSSFYALHPLYLLLNSCGHTTIIIETSELVHYLPQLIDENSLVVAVSQSGQSAEVIRLLDQNDMRATIVGVTNTAASPLAHRANIICFTHAGTEFSVSAKTYVTALMTLQALGAALCGRDTSSAIADLGQASYAASTYLEQWREHVVEMASELEGIHHLFLVGRGRSLAAAGTGALILKESTGFHAEGMSSAAFRHGPMEMLGQETFVAVFAGDDPTLSLNVKLLQDVRNENARAELIGMKTERTAWRLPQAPTSLLPILEILPVQMMTLALAAQSGIEAGRFMLATKITTVE